MPSSGQKDKQYQLGETALSGPAVDQFKKIRVKNHSLVADEDRVRKDFGRLEDELIEQALEVVELFNGASGSRKSRN